MTDVYRQFFKVGNSQALELIKEIQEHNKKVVAFWLDIINDIGANTGIYVDNEGRLSDITFTVPPNKNHYKKTKRGWFPKRNNNKTRGIAKQLSSQRQRQFNEILPILGFNGINPILLRSGMAYYVTILVIPEETPQVYIAVPCYDEDPLVLQEYVNDPDSSNLTLDLLLWEPPEYLTKKKKWEIDRAVEEYNEKQE